MADEQEAPPQRSIPLPVDSPIWPSFFTVAPLVIVGTMEPDGESPDLAPKHMAMPLGWSNFFCFVCSPRHATQRNAQRTGAFTVSFPRPEQIVATSLAAGPRDEAGDKPDLEAIATFPAAEVEGVLVRDAYLWLECRLDRVVDGFGENTMIIGEVAAAAVAEDSMRSEEDDDSDLVAGSPLLAYVSPGRFARISQTYSFPFHTNFRL
jgi:flavin reductase (DIM6/NTAB) family NADH-FMN oxidoreductase RutF